MKKFALMLIASVLLCACDRRPARNDLPKSEGNSVEHTRTVTVSIETSPNAAGSPYGAQFLDTMIADHEAVIDVAQLAQTRAGNTELKGFILALIAKHQVEIKQMRRLRQIDFVSAPPSINTDLAGVKTGALTLDPDKLDLLKEQLFDKEFLLETIRHHEGALDLLTDAGEKLNAADDLREFISTATNDRQTELDQMKKWQAVWFK
ncbi:MAG: DUF305 domain-containing protein [Acidobacteriota bacterium]